MAEKPRALQVMSRDLDGSTPLGRKRIYPHDAAKLYQPLVAEVIAGNVPLREDLLPALRMVMKDELRKALRKKDGQA